MVWLSVTFLVTGAVGSSSTTPSAPPHRSPAPGQTLTPALSQALSKEQTDPKEAVRLLGAVDPSSPEGARADYERARLTDAALRDLPAADLLYRRHLKNFPQSPYLRLAQTRAAYLEANMGDSPQALAEFESVTEAWGRRAAPDLEPRMERIVRDFPNSPIRGRALFWLSNVRVAAHDSPGAIRWLRQLIDSSPSPKELHRADLQIALIEQRAGHYAQALEIDERYLDSDDPLAKELAHNQKESALNARLYSRLYVAGLSLIGLLAGALSLGIWRRRAPLRPLPWELKLYLPIAGLFSVLALARDTRVGLAVSGIVAGGALLAALNGAYLRVARTVGWQRLAYLGAVGGAAASLAFCAVHAARLTDLVVTTLQQGADR